MASSGVAGSRVYRRPIQQPWGEYPGYTHVALRVESVRSTIVGLREHGIHIAQGPVSFGRDGHVSVFVRDPDLNVIELRGREEDLSSLGGVTDYKPEN
jgi:catechol 2,3-dioxygenase-like lactoylglutathione lyase family enzyme